MFKRLKQDAFNRGHFEGYLKARGEAIKNQLPNKTREQVYKKGVADGIDELVNFFSKDKHISSRLAKYLDKRDK